MRGLLPIKIHSSFPCYPTMGKNKPTITFPTYSLAPMSSPGGWENQNHISAAYESVVSRDLVHFCNNPRPVTTGSASSQEARERNKKLIYTTARLWSRRKQKKSENRSSTAVSHRRGTISISGPALNLKLVDTFDALSALRTRALLLAVSTQQGSVRASAHEGTRRRETHRLGADLGIDSGNRSRTYSIIDSRRHQS